MTGCNTCCLRIPYIFPRWPDFVVAMCRSRVTTLFVCIQYDLKNHRVFLHRVKAESVRLEDLYIGSTVNVLSRQLTFVDFGDDFTRNRVATKTEKYVLLSTFPRKVGGNFYYNYYLTLNIPPKNHMCQSPSLQKQIG